MFGPLFDNIISVINYQLSRFPGTIVDPNSSLKWDWGWRINPITNEKQWHNGIDLPAPEGTPIKVPLDGVIEKMAHDDLNGYYLRITHDSKEFPEIYQTRYAHLYEKKPYPDGMRVGDFVKQGQVVGYVGTSGASTGPHLHFVIVLKQPQIIDGFTRYDTDPFPYITGKKKKY